MRPHHLPKSNRQLNIIFRVTFNQLFFVHCWKNMTWKLLECKITWNLLCDLSFLIVRNLNVMMWSSQMFAIILQSNQNLWGINLWTVPINLRLNARVRHHTWSSFSGYPVTITFFLCLLNAISSSQTHLINSIWLLIVPTVNNSHSD